MGPWVGLSHCLVPSSLTAGLCGWRGPDRPAGLERVLDLNFQIYKSCQLLESKPQ